jgi:hypothetical protein
MLPLRPPEEARTSRISTAYNGGNSFIELILGPVILTFAIIVR